MLATPPITAAATQACLERLPGAVVGLPPARPPLERVTFVYRAPPAHLAMGMVAQLGAWRGRAGAYEGVTVSFFRTPRAAHRFVAAIYDGTVVGDRAVQWDRVSPSWRGVLRRCLSSTHGSRPATRPAPSASLSTFVGYWGGHTRGLRIGADREAREVVDSGCCTRVYELGFRLLSVRGTLTRGSATYRVQSFKRYPGGPRLRVGQVGRLVLRNGIVTNTLTEVYFCSDPAWGATGLCGA